MSIALAKKYESKVDELFKAESKTSLLTNTNYNWTGSHSILIYKMTTAPLNNYARNIYAPGVGEDETEQLSRYGKLYDLSATTEELMLNNDKSFIFNIDRMDEDETNKALSAETALARELREVVIPTLDTYVYSKLIAGAGTTATAAALTASNIYTKILDGTTILDDNEVPETERVLLVTPDTYSLLKQATEFDHTEVGAELRRLGVVGMLDGMAVVKVPKARLATKFGFMIVHPSACVAPIKLEDYNIHENTPLSSGSIVTGRVYYDAFVLANKTKGIYYQPIV